ncbi:MAG: cation:proton antiporter [Hyphomicrobiaceae bacterium]|nr:cation:proton antiporter [Hyphomicrobiaceae bacterium]
MTASLLLSAMFMLAYTMVAKRLSSTVLTAPMLFLAFGYLLSQTKLAPHAEVEQVLHITAEVALVLLLFLDAAQTDFAALRRRHVWPQRMLLVGLPLAILFGAVAAWFLLPGWPVFALLLVASVLAPTDAALGQAVVTNPLVPERPRRALTVESGLNDGLALPAVLLFASLTAEEMSHDKVSWLVFGIKQLTLGPLVGAAFGFAGAYILLQAKARDYTSDVYEGVGALALAGAAYLAATAVGGNGFIAAFAAGLCFGSQVRGQCKFIYEFTESEGQLITWSAFLLIGAALVPEALDHLTPTTFALILLSLFIVRPLAIWISLIGTDAAPVTRGFFGWFGPRGLATALFALLVVDKTVQELGEPILMLAINTVWISALLHGLTAVPGARWYAQRIKRKGDCAEVKKLETSP